MNLIYKIEYIKLKNPIYKKVIKSQRKIQTTIENNQIYIIKGDQITKRNPKEKSQRTRTNNQTNIIKGDQIPKNQNKQNRRHRTKETNIIIIIIKGD